MLYPKICYLLGQEDVRILEQEWSKKKMDNWILDTDEECKAFKILSPDCNLPCSPHLTPDAINVDANPLSFIKGQL